MAAQASFKSPGLSPGTLVYVGDQAHASIRISVVDYTPDTIEEVNDLAIDDLPSLLKRESTTWISVSGIQDTAAIEDIGRLCGLHPLTLEDVVNTNHRPKLDEFDDYLFFILKMPKLDASDGSLSVEHICLVVGKGFLISFQEAGRGVYSVRYGRDCGYPKGAFDDMVAIIWRMHCSIWWWIIILRFWSRLARKSKPCRRAYWTIRNPAHCPTSRISVTILCCCENRSGPCGMFSTACCAVIRLIIDDKLLFYYQDVYDHVIQVADTVETNRDQMSGILDMYMSSVSIKMNEVMKVLTVIATLFIPMTFLAGVYGMNFKYMPELEWQYSYPLFWGTVLVCLCAMMIWFKRNKWL